MITIFVFKTIRKCVLIPNMYFLPYKPGFSLCPFGPNIPIVLTKKEYIPDQLNRHERLPSRLLHIEKRDYCKRRKRFNSMQLNKTWKNGEALKDIGRGWVWTMWWGILCLLTGIYRVRFLPCHRNHGIGMLSFLKTAFWKYDSQVLEKDILGLQKIYT